MCLRGTANRCEPIQTLGKVIPESNNFQDARGFLLNNGQRGPQRGIVREGTYAFNLAQSHHHHTG